MKITKLFLTGCLTVAMCSCADYLDIVPDNVASIDYAFRNKKEAYKYLTSCYNYIPMEGSLKNVPCMSASDELWTYSENIDSYKGFRISRGSQNSSEPLLNWWDGSGGDGSAKSLYGGIRNCNIMIENVDNVPDLTYDECNRWKAEAKFLKAYFHFCLLRLYGPVPIVDVNLPITASPEEMKLYREPVDDCVKYICNLLDEAAPNLPLLINVPVTEMGRVTRPAAKALKAKVLVTAASPLFNGNPDFMSMKDNKGRYLFPQQKDDQKWVIAANACKEAIDLCKEAGIELYYFKGDTKDMSPTLIKTMDIRESVCDRWNSETIFAITNWEPATQQKQFQPRLSADYSTMNNCQNWGPPMHIAEMFYTKNGVPLKEDKTDDYYGKRFDKRIATAADNTYIESGRTTVQLHFDREPRFYASLAFDGSAWSGDGRNKDGNLWYIHGRKNEYSGQVQNANYTQTGYYVKKLVSYQNSYVVANNTYTAFWFPMPILRLADLYLLYSEALNETMQTPSDEVYFYIDEVRKRAGLDGVVDSWADFSSNPNKPLNQTGMREIIHQERLIELVFEGQRFWDIRRWRRLEEFMNEPVVGWNIQGEDVNSYYTPLTYFKRKYSRRDYFWPIKDETLRRNSNLVQNIGW